MDRSHYGCNNVNAGPLKKWPEICVDRFLESDLKSTAFFLTHGHTDHLVGLDSQVFLSRLNQDGIKLYCHALTPILVASFKRYLGGSENIKYLIKSGKIVLLENGKSTEIQVPSDPEDYPITVTLLPAGHCPGSVMFLFEKDDFRILHTGDCRISQADIQQISHLNVYSTGVDFIPKRIDHLYVDTTFCSPEAKKFPDRKNVISELMDRISNWRTKSMSNRVFIEFPAKFSHEYVLIRLYDKFSEKIHVSKEKFEIYQQFPKLASCVTLDNRTPFHYCDDQRCGKNENNVLIVRMSSLWYIKGKDSVGSVIMQRGRRLQVCYAMHSSLQEVAQIIDTLQPAVVTPLVKPPHSNVIEVEGALRSICRSNFIFVHYQGDYSAQQAAESKDDSLSVEKNKRKCSHLNSEDYPQEEKIKRLGSIQSEWDFKLSQSPTKGSQNSDSPD